MIRLLTVLLAALAWGPGAAAAATGPDAALATLNAWRAQAGVPGVARMDARAGEGCRAHNRYMARTGDFGHAEDPASAYATPLGAATGAAALLAEGEGGLALFTGAVYHRVALLEPRLRVAGFAASSGYTCLRVRGGSDDSPAARTAGVTLFPWPYDGQRDVPTAGPARGTEIPDPYAVVGGAERLGYLLSVNFNGPWAYTSNSTVEVAATWLTSAAGTSVPVTAADLDGALGLFPHAPLARATWYTAQAEGELRNDGRAYPFSVSWSFQTARYDPALRVQARDGWVSVASRNPARVRVRLRQAGQVAVDLWLAPGEAAEVPAGRYAACAAQRGSDRYRDAARCDDVRVGA